MKIEIVEYYPDDPGPNNEIRGTLHIYYVDKGMDIRGINCFKKNKKWFIYLPNGWGIDEETKEKMRFPIISFSDISEQKELQKLIRKQGKAYIEEKLKSEKTE